MKIVNPNDTNHTIKLIPRIYTEPFSFELYNEFTKVFSLVNHTSSIVNGIVSVNFDFTFTENEKYQIKIFNVDEIIYRGKLMATSQNPQSYQITKDLYNYG